MKKLALYKCFNPVAPTRGATGNNGANGLPAQLFQSTHPHGVRPAYQDLIIPDSEFQSTHPHGVRLLALSSSYPLLRFQSTHPHGVRPRTFAPCRCLDCFNPRTHTGCDNAWSKALPLRRVSIHAPTRGATLVSERKFFTVAFQSTHPHGVRLLHIDLLWHIVQFQSTHPHGVRLFFSASGPNHSEFQSTHPHGVRPP